MNLKTFLLGTGAAFAVVSGAQAADLAMAEPVDYVKVCDAAGVGYWYIPGTDTCLKIGGRARFDIVFHDDAAVDNGGAHVGNWEFITDAYLSVTAKSMTDYGWLTGFLAFVGDSNNKSYDGGGNDGNGNAAAGADGSKYVKVDEAFLSIGPLLAGRTGSTYDYGGGFNIDGSDLDSDHQADQVRLSWAMSGYGVMFGIEDPRDRWGTNSNNDIPDLIAAITASQGPWDAKLSAGYSDLVNGGGWGVQAAATVKLDQIAAGDQFRVKFAYSADGAGSFSGTPITDGTTNGSAWSALASFQHFWTPQVSSAFTVGYASPDATPDMWQAAGNIVWSPAHNFSVGTEVVYNSNGPAPDTWQGKIRLERDWGG